MGEGRGMRERKRQKEPRNDVSNFEQKLKTCKMQKFYAADNKSPTVFFDSSVFFRFKLKE